MKQLYKFIFILMLSLSFAYGQEAAGDSTLQAQPSVESALKQEIALRDSLMDVQGNACNVEKDSLRAAIASEQAKSENWEQSYNTIKKNNEVCAQALSVSLGVNEKKKEKEDEDRKAAAMMTSTSFLGGIGAGLLIMWLIMK